MKKNVNGIERDMTVEEITEFQSQQITQNLTQKFFVINVINLGQIILLTLQLEE